MLKHNSVFKLILIIFMTNTLISQQIIETDFDKSSKEQTVKQLSALLIDKYVFPETGKKMAEFINSNLKDGKYDEIADPKQFSQILTADLQLISKDKHLTVSFNPKEAAQILDASGSEEEPKELNLRLEQMKNENFGFFKVERLEGNIGYVDFRTNYSSLEHSKETIKSVLSFISNCKAVIFDLRKNGGCYPQVVQYIESHFFNNEPIHLNDLYYREGNRTESFWTLKDIEGKRMPEVPLYILTGKNTFSGAEEFAYDMKNLKRAVIVGESTGGGANPGQFLAINKDFVTFLPTGRAINPITGTNWEGNGVKPDIEVKSENALNKAHSMAIQTLAEKSADEIERSMYEWISDALVASENPPSADANKLKSYTGTYEDRTITFEDGRLFYQRKDRPKLEMTLLAEDTFMFKDAEFFRLKFLRDGNGKITGLTGIYENGQKDISMKKE